VTALSAHLQRPLCLADTHYDAILLPWHGGDGAQMREMVYSYRTVAP
jgi:hypothetical protein